ncbi:MAG: hypothetical protein Q9170_003646, partial [Blastenia crenularia]
AAFPPDTEMNAAIANSERTYSIDMAQHDDDEDGQYAATVAASLAEAAPKLDISETGLEDPPPHYYGSNKDAVVNHFKFTSSDYRREKPGSKKPINDDILKIMRLYAEFLAFYAEVEAADDKGKGKGKATPLALPEASPAQTAAEAAAPEVATSLDETGRLPLRSEATMAAPTPAGAAFMMRNLPPAARKAMQGMQAQSQAISQSKLMGYRKRAPLEAHNVYMSHLQIEREEDDGVGSSAGQGTAKNVKKRSGF